MSSLESAPVDLVRDPARLEVLSLLHDGSAGVDSEFDTLAELAASVLGVQTAFVCLVGSGVQHVKGSTGLSESQSAKTARFCQRCIAEAEGTSLVVTDASTDPRFAGDPLVEGPAGARFCAGFPISVQRQFVGSLCAIDVEPRENLSSEEFAQMRRLASLAGALLELQASARLRRRAELAQHRAEFRHSLALRAASIASWVWDIPSDELECDDDMRAMYGLPNDLQLTADHFLKAIHPDDIATVRATLEQALASDEDYRMEFRVAATGRWLLVLGRVYERAADGGPLSVVGVIIDITSTKQTEDKTRLLLRELNHRVKNTLAMLQSLAAQTLRRAQTPAEFMRAFSGRLQALAAAHTLLSDREWGQVEVHTLLEALITPYSIVFDECVHIEGENVPIGPEEGLGLGMVVHELATNAVRHGALSVRNGKLTVTTSIRAETEGLTLIIRWVETGGPAVSRPSHEGFGAILIERGLQKILGSKVEVEYHPQGVRATILLPLGTSLPRV